MTCLDTPLDTTHRASLRLTKTQVAPQLRSLFWLLIGLGLCSTIPLAPIGPSFIVWPSTSEIAGYVLFVIAAGKLFGSRRGRQAGYGTLPRSYRSLWTLVVLYVCVVTTVLTVWHGYSALYPAWSLMRFAHWAVIISYLLFVCRPREIRLLVLGIVVGGIVNVGVAVLQRYGYLMPETLFSHLSTDGGGRFGVLAEKGLTKAESVGVFSYTRIATAFFLAFSFFAGILFTRDGLFRLVLLIVFACGIIFTGSRLGFLVFLFMLVAFFLHGRHTPVVFCAGCLLGLLALTFWDMIQNDFVIGRLFGMSDTYERGVELRVVRQLLVFKLPKTFILFGCGLGNLGSALGLSSLRFYRAHGWFFTYLGELGVVGVALLLILVSVTIKRLGALQSSYGVVVLLCIASSGFADDFMIPSAQAGHIPLITAIVLRFAVLQRGYRIRLGLGHSRQLCMHSLATGV